MHELSKLLEVKIRHATLKHAQSVGVVERSHGALKRILKLNTNEQWSNWQLYFRTVEVPMLEENFTIPGARLTNTEKRKNIIKSKN